MDRLSEYLEQLYNEEYSELYHMAVLMLGDFYLAEDAVEEVFVTIICHFRWWTKLPERERVGYAKKVCALVCRRMLKKRERVYLCEFKEELGEGDLASVKERELLENEDALRYALTFLKKEDRELFKDKYYGGLSNKMLAEKYGISESVVAKRLQRGREMLYRILK